MVGNGFQPVGGDTNVTATVLPITEDIPQETVTETIPEVTEEIHSNNNGFYEQVITIKYSWYNPELGGTNCSVFMDGICVSKMASGKPWAFYMDKAAACPPEWDFGTKIILDGREYECLDRGGAIKYDGQGYAFVDFLTQSPTHSFGEYVEVIKINP
jgi:hypothetical protein